MSMTLGAEFGGNHLPTYVGLIALMIGTALRG
jgi:hypothetical protein